jgi:RNase P subunit RPR2
MPDPRVIAARRAARRLWPLALAAYRQWQQLTPEQKERYRKLAREYAQRGRTALERRRGRGGPGRRS